MKFKHFITAVLVVLSTASFAQTNITQTTLEVDGLCGMCKKRIENAAYLKGVKQVSWSIETHALELVYRNDKVSEAEIIAAINEAGHDVAGHLATDEQYSAIHGCCRFRDPAQRAAHGLGEALCTPNESAEEHSKHEEQIKH
jgi:mercuric ion binding protein